MSIIDFAKDFIKVKPTGGIDIEESKKVLGQLTETADLHELVLEQGFSVICVIVEFQRPVPFPATSEPQTPIWVQRMSLLPGCGTPVIFVLTSAKVVASNHLW
jgi:hypothetical protein